MFIKLGNASLLGDQLLEGAEIAPRMDAGVITNLIAVAPSGNTDPAAP